MSRLQDVIADRKLSQAKAAALLGIAQPDLSNVLRGRFRGYSVGRLLHFLTALGCELEIVVRALGERAKAEQICAVDARLLTFCAASARLTTDA